MMDISFPSSDAMRIAVMILDATIGWMRITANSAKMDLSFYQGFA